MAVDIYQADNQLDELKTLLDVTAVKTELSITDTVTDQDGNVVNNDFGVMIQSPYYLMPNYLPQIIIDIQSETITDQNFDQAETSTLYYVYYVKSVSENDPTALQDMYTSLAYIARFLIGSYRTNGTSYQTMTLPRIEPNNEINRFFLEQVPRLPLWAGRISFELRDKRAYR